MDVTQLPGPQGRPPLRQQHDRPPPAQARQPALITMEAALRDASVRSPGCYVRALQSYSQPLPARA